MKTETIKEHAERLLAYGIRRLNALHNIKAPKTKKAIRKTNKYLRAVINLSKEYSK